MWYLTLNEILEVDRQVMAQSGGAEGLMQLPALESAIAQPQMTFGGEDMYPTRMHKAASKKPKLKEKLRNYIKIRGPWSAKPFMQFAGAGQFVAVQAGGSGIRLQNHTLPMS